MNEQSIIELSRLIRSLPDDATRARMETIIGESEYADLASPLPGEIERPELFVSGFFHDIAMMELADFKPGCMYIPGLDTLCHLEEDVSTVTVYFPSNGAAVLWNADRTKIVGVEIFGVRAAISDPALLDG